MNKKEKRIKIEKGEMTKILAEDLSMMERLVDAESYQVWKFKITVILKANDLYKLITEQTSRENKTAK